MTFSLHFGTADHDRAVNLNCKFNNFFFLAAEKNWELVRCPNIYYIFIHKNLATEYQVLQSRETPLKGQTVFTIAR